MRQPCTCIVQTGSIAQQSCYAATELIGERGDLGPLVLVLSPNNRGLESSTIKPRLYEIDRRGRARRVTYRRALPAAGRAAWTPAAGLRQDSDGWPAALLSLTWGWTSSDRACQRP
jgi:hypothetical protein